jgi:hypothetical protein
LTNQRHFATVRSLAAKGNDMSDLEIRSALATVLGTLEMLAVQANEATISAHAIRMAIADSDPKMTIRIGRKYQQLVNSSKPVIEQLTAAIRGIALTLASDPNKGVN